MEYSWLRTDPVGPTLLIARIVLCGVRRSEPLANEPGTTKIVEASPIGLGYRFDVIGGVCR